VSSLWLQAGRNTSLVQRFSQELGLNIPDIRAVRVTIIGIALDFIEPAAALVSIHLRLLPLTVFPSAYLHGRSFIDLTKP